MLSCKEIAHILASEEDLSIMRRTELRMHLLMCKHCSNYNKQLRFLKSGMKKLFKQKTNIDSEKVKKLEEEIIKKVSSSDFDGSN